jgi:OHS family lactose permease-like MFS transporter
MVGVSFGHSVGIFALSSLAGIGYDRIGFPATYLTLAGMGLVFLILSAVFLLPTPPETAPSATAPLAEPAK